MRISFTPRPLWSTYAIFVSATLTTVNSGIAMLSLRTPPPVTLRNTSTPCARRNGGRPIEIRNAAASAAARTAAKVPRFTSSPSRSGVVEPEVDPEECFPELLGQGRERRRFGDRTQRRLVVEQIAGGLLHREPADLSVAADLEDDLRLGAV